MPVARVQSLGLRTDLALLEHGGSDVVDRGDHLVVRSLHNPSHYWGNFLLLREVPPHGEAGAWLERFAREFPEARHVALAVDGVDLAPDDLAELSERGLSVDASTVMTAAEAHDPQRPNTEATFRTLDLDEDWAQSVELQVACDEEYEPRAYRQFAERRAATNRALVRAGHGAWFGAFLDGRLVSEMGLFRASPGLARFQLVSTHPAFRRRGLAGTLVAHASRYGVETLGAETLVMVADPEDEAIRIYRSVGFRDAESFVQAERAAG